MTRCHSTLCQKMASPTQLPPRDTPLLLWDGECGFCARSVSWLRRMTSNTLDELPSEHRSGDAKRLTDEALAQAVHLLDRDGSVWTGAAAIFRALDLGGCRSGSLLWWLYRKLPLFAPVAEAGYRLVARSRRCLPGRSCSVR